MKTVSKLIAATVLGIVLASTAVVVAKPTTTTTTTTTIPATVVPPSGTIDCPEGDNVSAWSDWIATGPYTKLIVNASIEGAGYPSVQMGFSTDGVNPVSPDGINPFANMSLSVGQEVRMAWPYFHIRCYNPYTGTPNVAWKVLQPE